MGDVLFKLHMLLHFVCFVKQQLSCLVLLTELVPFSNGGIVILDLDLH